MEFYPRLFEGVADKYAEREFGLPDETKSQEDVVNREAIKETDKVVVKTSMFMIIKNPTSLKDFRENVRAVFSKEGNLYVADKRNIAHSAMIEYLVGFGEIKDQEKWWWRNPIEFITLERVGMANKFAIGESNDTMDPELDEHTREHYQMPYFEECQSNFKDWIKKANQLFPKYKFINKHIKFLNDLTAWKYKK